MDLQQLLMVDEVWIINLDRRGDRLQKMYKNVYPLFLNVKRFSAIDARNMSNEELAQTVSSESIQNVLKDKRSFHEELSKGAVGCYLSHVELWEYSLRTNKKLLILEDDIRLINSTRDELLNGKIKLPDNYDVLLLSASNINGRTMYPGVQQVYKFFGTGAYIVTPQFVAKIKPFLFPIKYQIDALMSFFSFFTKICSIHLFDQSIDQISDAQTSNSSVTKFLGIPECPNIGQSMSRDPLVTFIVIGIVILFALCGLLIGITQCVH